MTRATYFLAKSETLVNVTCWNYPLAQYQLGQVWVSPLCSTLPALWDSGTSHLYPQSQATRTGTAQISSYFRHLMGKKTLPLLSPLPTCQQRTHPPFLEVRQLFRLFRRMRGQGCWGTFCYCYVLKSAPWKAFQRIKIRCFRQAIPKHLYSQCFIPGGLLEALESEKFLLWGKEARTYQNLWIYSCQRS